MNKLQIMKADAVAAYGGNQAALAKDLCLSRQAVSAWPDGPIAEGYALKLRFVLKPEVFGSGVPLTGAGEGAPNARKVA